MFAEAFNSAQALLQTDALVVVEGEVSNDDFSGGLRLRAKRVMSLEEARTGLAESLRVKVAGEALRANACAGWPRSAVAIAGPVRSRWSTPDMMHGRFCSSVRIGGSIRRTT